MPDVRGTCVDVDGTVYALVVQGDSAVRLYLCDVEGDPKRCVGSMFMDSQKLDEALPMVEWTDGILIRPQVVTWFMEDGERILKGIVEG